MDVYEKLADVHAERGLVANAAEDYLKVAKHYAKEGDMQSSIAVYRKLANLDPKNFAVRQKLAEICQKWGLAKEAIEEYSKVLSIFKDRQMTSEAQEVIDKVMKIDPTFAGTTSPVDENVSAEKSQASIPPSVIEAGAPLQEEVSSQETSLPQEASSPPSPSEPIILPAAEPAREEVLAVGQDGKGVSGGDWSAAELLVEEVQDQPAEAFAYLSKWVDFFLKGFISQGLLDSSESGSSRRIASALIREPITHTALPCGESEQVSAHQLLGEFFERSGEEGEAIQCYSKIVSLLHHQRSTTDAQAYYEEIKSRLPGISEDEHCRRLFEPEEEAAEESAQEAAIEPLPLEPLEEPLQAEAAAPVIEEALPELEPAAEELPEPVDINEVSQAPAESVSAESKSAEALVDEISETTFQGHLTEAEVYIKYGLNSKAIEQLTLLRKLALSREEPSFN